MKAHQIPNNYYRFVVFDFNYKIVLIVKSKNTITHKQAIDYMDFLMINGNYKQITYKINYAKF